MSHLVPGPPKPVEKQPPNVNVMTTKLKLFLVLLVMLAYVYVLYFVKTMYGKVKRMDRMNVLVMETQQMLHQLHVMDQNQGIDIEQLDNMYEDY
ncbi:unnamed protein product, partial [Iphiclides podalirius]